MTQTSVMDEMTMQDMNTIIEHFLENYFGIEWQWDLRVNNRMKAYWGWFEMNSNSISLAGFLVRGGTAEGITQVLLHEAIHLALCNLNVEFDDFDPTFEHTLKLFGISSNKKYEGNHRRVLMLRNKTYRYICPKCKRNYHDACAPLQKKINPTVSYTCTSCFGKNNLTRRQAEEKNMLFKYNKTYYKEGYAELAEIPEHFKEDYDMYVDLMKNYFGE